MTVYVVDLLEPASPLTADSTYWTADSTEITADAISLPAVDSGDAVVNGNFVYAEIIEPVRVGWTADSTAVTADSTFWTADGGPIVGALDFTDAEVIAAELPIGGGGLVLRDHPVPVAGTGHGVLPRLWGEAHGVVGVAVDAAVPLRLAGEAHGEVDDDLELELALLIMLAA